MASVVAMLGVAVLVIAWAAWAVSVLAGKADHSSLPVKALVKN